MAELKAAIFAITSAWEKGWHKLWLESDSTYVVNLIRSRSQVVPWQLRIDWSRCIEMMDSMQVVTTHVFREGNQLADRLANFGRDATQEHWWTPLAPFCSSLIYDDISRIERFRFIA